jgi:uncharacterized protein (DUF58 family)
MSGHSFLIPETINRLMHLTLQSTRPVMGSVSGKHRSPVRGSSLEFAQYRKYEIGDDSRRVDWRVWGRTDRAYVKEFEADTNLRMLLVLDASGSMNFAMPGATVSKLDQSKQLAGALSWVASRQGDAVGLADSSPNGIREIPPRRGARHLRAILDRMESLKANGESDLPQALHFVAEKLPRRGLVVIVSDLFSDIDALANSIRHLRHRKHDIAIFHLLDNAEVDFDFDQPMKFIDLENGTSMLSDPVIVGENYRQVVAKYMADLKHLVRATGIDYRRITLQSDIAEELAGFLNSRASGRGSRARQR